MIRLVFLALLALMALCGSAARATTVYHDLRIIASSPTESSLGPGDAIGPFSGRLIYTTGVTWLEQPTELLYADLVIDGHVFDKLDVFKGASFVIVSQGDTSTLGVDGLYMLEFDNYAYMTLTLAGREGVWNVNNLVLERTWSMDPIAIPTAPVPEPQTYAMFLAGVSLVTALARRRKPMV
ncbi:MAG TPA: PEP-CTERM sorting domain-containing protein [Duganella sp.]|jgi:hypothetical protein